MKSWTRTLNLDDAHTLLALVRPGMTEEEWSVLCHEELPELSPARRRELIRLLREGYLEWDEQERVLDGRFLHAYDRSPALGQVDLVQVQWALSHPLTLLAVDALVEPALHASSPKIPLPAVEAFVAAHLETDSEESLRKTRTVLLGAMEGVGVLTTRGTGQHRSLAAARGAPHPTAFAYLLRRELDESGRDVLPPAYARTTSLPVRLTRCTPEHAAACLDWCVQSGGWRNTPEGLVPVD
jgi:hypothetical protein